MAHILNGFALISKLLILIDAESCVMFDEKSFRICTLCKFTVLVIIIIIFFATAAIGPSVLRDYHSYSSQTLHEHSP